MLIALLAGVAAGVGRASPAAELGSLCGLPDDGPRIEYADWSVSFRNEIFGRPGVVAATFGTRNAADRYAREARTPSTGG